MQKPHINQALGKTTFNQSLRAFINDANNQAIAKLPMVAKIIYADGKEHHLGILSTDSNGYISFKFVVEPHSEIKAISLAPLGLDHLAQDVFPLLHKQGNMSGIELTYNDAVNIRSMIASGKNQSFLSIQNPDPLDYHISPGSLATQPELTLGNGDCARLIPAHNTTYTYQYGEIVKKNAPLENVTIASLTNSDCSEKVKVVAIGEGKLQEYKLDIIPKGYSLGELLYSVTLAPCESVRIAVIDWIRQEQAYRQENNFYQETYISQYNRSLFAQEVLSASLQERSFSLGVQTGVGNSNKASASGNASIPLKGATIGLGGALSSAVTSFVNVGIGYSSGRRQIAAESTQSMVDNIQQRANLARRYSSSIVMEANQVEQESVITRAICNHNHCHTLNVFYYQVIQHYLIQNTFIGEGDIYWVKYENNGFTEENVIRYQHLLKSALLDPSLLPCFQALEKSFLCEGTSNGGGGTTPVVGDLYTQRIEGEIKIGDTTGSPFDGELYLEITVAGLNEVIHGNPLEPIGTKKPGKKRYEKGKTYSFAFNLSSPVKVSDIQQITLRSEPDEWTDAKFILDHIKVNYTTVEIGGLFSLLNNGNNVSMAKSDRKTYQTSPERTTYEYEEDVPGAGTPGTGTNANQACCTQRLLRHLNCNKLHYNKAIWLYEDADERAIRFENVIANGEPLINQIKNEPIAIQGNCVAFKVSDYALQAQTPIITKEHITMPTRGIFSEGILGHCNTCEKVNDEVFWDWSESPCNCGAPDITVATGNAGSNLSGSDALKPTDFMQNSVNVQTGGDIPVSALGNLLEALSADSKLRDPEVLADLSELFKTLGGDGDK
ncbi:hypothetical protein [uncultured Microscilla sp.]|uniref:hypothetical protein n=1 Tax=uncultured Microscilla sp. TaxID=432653 RepID=UPI00261A234F|nr:hypothetical protein [uncultured Microscilla sp.]